MTRRRGWTGGVAAVGVALLLSGCGADWNRTEPAASPSGPTRPQATTQATVEATPSGTPAAGEQHVASLLPAPFNAPVAARLVTAQTPFVNDTVSGWHAVLGVRTGAAASALASIAAVLRTHGYEVTATPNGSLSAVRYAPADPVAASGLSPSPLPTPSPSTSAPGVSASASPQDQIAPGASDTPSASPTVETGMRLLVDARPPRELSWVEVRTVAVEAPYDVALPQEQFLTLVVLNRIT